MQKVHTIFQRLIADIRQTKAALVILLVYLFSTQLLFGTVCPFAITFGFPCPACGLTRAGLCLLTLQFSSAFSIHAAIFLWAPFLLYLIFFRYFLGRRPPHALSAAVIISLATLFYYGVRLLQGTLTPVPCKGLLPLTFHAFIKQSSMV